MWLFWLMACTGAEDDTAGTGEPLWQLPLPAGYPEPYVPADNPATPETFELGRHLFFDERLSGNQTQSCGTCHLQSMGFADGKATPLGSTGDVVPRNSPPLLNVAWFSTYTWPNPVLETLEEQVLVPLYGESPVELGLAGLDDEVRARLGADETLGALAEAAFPGDPDPFGPANLARALATYVRGLASAQSPYDRWVAGDDDAISSDAKVGYALFFSEKTECYHCHSGPNFSASWRTATTQGGTPAFANTGLYNIDGTGAYPPTNQGLYAFTGEPADMGRFRVPSLRNLPLTAPYMHDGSVATLEEVIDIYDRGGRLVEEGAYAGDGAENPYKDPLVRRMDLTDDEKRQLLAFLETLTDEAFVADPALGDPAP